MALTEAEKAELAQLEAEYAKPKLSPAEQAELARLERETSDSIMGIPKTTIQGALESLPIAGSAAGGMIGGVTGLPAFGVGAVGGAVAGAGIGGALGASLKNLGEQYLLGKDKTREDIYLDPAMGFVEGATGEMGGRIIGKGAQVAAQTKVGQKAISAAGRGLAKVGNALTGVPEQEIITYANYADDIKRMAKESDNNVSEAADAMRSKFTDAVHSTRRTLNKEVSSGLAGNSERVSVNPIIEELERAKAAYHPDAQSGARRAIEELQEKIRKFTKGRYTDMRTLKTMSDDTVGMDDLNKIKNTLQDTARPSYMQPGQVFENATAAQSAAKSGGAKTRVMLNERVPSVASANNKLAELHEIDDLMNANLIAEGKPESALLAAGSGGNSRSAMNLKRLGDLTGTDMLTDAQKLASMRTFGSPKLMAVDATGKSAARLGVGTGLGFMLGGAPGALVGGALTSPFALRSVMDGSRAAAPLLKAPISQHLLMRSLMDEVQMPSAWEQMR